MSEHSNIEWTDSTWPVVTGCDKISPGCTNCYAIHDGWRLSHNPNPTVCAAYQGTVQRTAGGSLNWSGLVKPQPARLDWPLKWRRPRRIFVCNQSDLFHEDVPDEFITAVFGVMAACCRHTFQVLTKRSDRMRDYLKAPDRAAQVADAVRALAVPNAIVSAISVHPGLRLSDDPPRRRWPLPNVWCGVSVEDQQRADERIPLLLQTPAAIRFLSCEPLLGPVRLDEVELPPEYDLSRTVPAHINALTSQDDEHFFNHHAAIDWVIAGGESGSNARRCDVEWVRSIVRQCAAAGVPAFVKQLGARPTERGDSAPDWWTGAINGDGSPRFADRKGGDPAEWPPDLRVRELPVRSEAGR